MVRSIGGEVARLRLLLDAAIRFKTENHRSVERKLGWSTSYLNKLIRGVSELHASHILAVLQALQIEPAAFFRVAFPDPGQPRAETPEQVVGALQAELGRGQAVGAFGPPTPGQVATAGELLLQAMNTLLPQLAAGAQAPQSPKAPGKPHARPKHPQRRKAPRPDSR